MRRVNLVVGAALVVCSVAGFVVGSRELARAAVGSGSQAGTSSREEVIRAYQDVLLPALHVPNDWVGRVDTCTPGHVSTAYREATLEAVNYARSLDGLPGVVLDDSLNEQAQQAALIMKASGELSHGPPPSWPCWTAVGADAAGMSNLAFGVAGAAAIVGYLADPGESNCSAGHRAWILDPTLAVIGTGDTDSTNALYINASQRAPAPDPAWHSWPASGFFPWQLEPLGRWSVYYPGADFSEASVHMTYRGVDIPLDNYNRATWDAHLPESLRAADGTDAEITVTVSGVLMPDGSVDDHTYSVTLIDADPSSLTGRPETPVIRGVKGHARSVTIRWTATPREGSEMVLQLEIRGPGTPLITRRTSQTHVTIGGLRPGVRYSARVRVAGTPTQQSSSWSAPVAVSTR